MTTFITLLCSPSETQAILNALYLCWIHIVCLAISATGSLIQDEINIAHSESDAKKNSAGSYALVIASFVSRRDDLRSVSANQQCASEISRMTGGCAKNGIGKGWLNEPTQFDGYLSWATLRWRFEPTSS
ncbi:uncharacterized protein FOMMEDRAFT_158268 [Fomitiporia mediterranea MF3/22]|uniref:uncharacterized protein n=1 Tax=Fomitiporia mediterranea (strain MF3/22) TaxID=694068 RepID=UPI0004409007|nr:uncharacterized protein FOMMEDRAFT_158268 [Fomitiporia mediterranea MF3/22]EJD01134.1 hypothetical protein FOMMEDRAFT_158268 [Fomitiporia mediterranea MF3/22]